MEVKAAEWRAEVDRHLADREQLLNEYQAQLERRSVEIEEAQKMLTAREDVVINRERSSLENVQELEAKTRAVDEKERKIL